MNLFQRFWYTIFEFISNKSNLRDMPYFGITLVLFELVGFFIAAVIGYRICFSVMCGMSPSTDTNYSRILWYIILSITLILMYFYNRKIGPLIIERFKEEEEVSRKKRIREAWIIVISDFLLMLGALIWRACQEA